MTGVSDDRKISNVDKSGAILSHPDICRWLTAFFSVGLLAVLGCHASPSKPTRPLTPIEAAGQQVFARQCAACHYADSDDGLQGPGLKGIFQKKYLPSGAVANDTRVSRVIIYGRAMMPAMGNNLTDQDLQELLAYLHTL